MVLNLPPSYPAYQLSPAGDSLSLVQLQTPALGFLEDDALLIRVHAAEVPRLPSDQPKPSSPVATVFQSLGWKRNIPGVAFAGEILASGRAVDNWTLGTKVCGLTTGASILSHGTLSALLVISKDACVIAMPDTLNYHQSAALPHAFMEAYTCIISWGNLPPTVDGTVAILNGSTPTGLIAMQLVVKTLKKRVVLSSATNLPSDLLQALGSHAQVLPALSPSELTHALAQASPAGYELILDLSPSSSPEFLASTDDLLQKNMPPNAGGYCTPNPTSPLASTTQKLKTLMTFTSSGPRKAFLAPTATADALRTGLALLASGDIQLSSEGCSWADLPSKWQKLSNQTITVVDLDGCQFDSGEHLA